MYILDISKHTFTTSKYEKNVGIEGFVGRAVKNT